MNHREKAPPWLLAKKELWATTYSCRNLVLYAKTKTRASSIIRKGNQGKVDIQNTRNYDRLQDFLCSEIGLEDSWQLQKVVQRTPTIASYTNLRLNEAFNLFRDLFQCSDQDLQGLFIKECRIFLYTKDTMESKIANISETFFGGNMTAVKIMLTKQPSILTVNFENNLLPKVEYLREKVFQGNETALVDTVLQCPRILTLSLNRTIIPRTEALRMCGHDPSQWIKSYTGLSLNKFRQWFERKTGEALPQDMFPAEDEKPQERYTFDERMQICVQVLSTELDMDRKEAIRLLEKCPAIKQCSVSNLQGILSYLLVLFGGSKGDVRSLVSRHPKLLAHSLKRLKAHVALLTQTWFPHHDDDVTDAAVLSLLNRLLPYSMLKNAEIMESRMHAMFSAGLDIAKVDPRSIAASNEQFEDWLAMQETSLQ